MSQFILDVGLQNRANEDPQRIITYALSLCQSRCSCLHSQSAPVTLSSCRPCSELFHPQRFPGIYFYPFVEADVLPTRQQLSQGCCTSAFLCLSTSPWLHRRRVDAAALRKKAIHWSQLGGRRSAESRAGGERLRVC